MNELEYQAAIAWERDRARVWLLRRLRQLRRETLGPFPDTIDVENAQSLAKAFTGFGDAMRQASAAFDWGIDAAVNSRLHRDPMHEWQASARVALGVMPPQDASRVVASLSLA